MKPLSTSGATSFSGPFLSDILHAASASAQTRRRFFTFSRVIWESFE